MEIFDQPGVDYSTLSTGLQANSQIHHTTTSTNKRRSEVQAKNLVFSSSQCSRSMDLELSLVVVVIIENFSAPL